ncbi:Eco57I restriction-modification methylase domain-containing protein [Nocardiopsis kunsanensis]|uniref:Eco57I restriction-modification methylase domain-containing protein n=1 Tax=Nocardiopsis kunsanensis TaxID=141693 RepID=UPI00034B20B2|nr:DNA methyltransferase [Nocardiopsis kunsanensis]
MSNPQYRSGRDSAEQHRNWLDLVEIDGPFLTLPVLLEEWPNGFEPLEKEERAQLRREHSRWQRDVAAGQQDWVRYVLGRMLGWQETLRTEGLEPLAMEVAEHDTSVTPAFALTTPDAAADVDAQGEAGEVKADSVRLLGLVLEPGQVPTARVRGESWSASPVDRLAKLCRHHGVELGLATDGRWWVLVWAPRGGVTTTVVFDAVLWPDTAERDVLHAFHSLLNRTRFFGVPAEETLVRMLSRSMDSQEEVTEALGVQVRQAVELLVAAIGRADTRARGRGEDGLAHIDAHEVYRGAVSVMMRVVFLLFAEERGLLPSDNDLYARAYSAGRLYDELQARVRESTEDDLENTSEGWHRLLALFHAVYHGVEHPRLAMHAHDGSLFDPETFPWLPLDIDDRTVLHMLKSVQYVQVGRGRKREPRKLSFRALDVEQIGYVYEGLLSFDGFRAGELVVGLVGKEGAEEEVALRELEELAARHTDLEELAKELSATYKASGIGTPKKLAKVLAPMSGEEKEEARNKLRGVVPRGEFEVAERLLPFYRLIRTDLRGLPMLVRAGELYVTESSLRKNTGTHYTPRFLAEEVVEGALEPLVYEPGPLQTAETGEWKLKSSRQILDLKVADIAMGSAAFLVAAARYLGDRLIEAWTTEGDARVEGYESAGAGLREDDDPVVIEARRQVIENCLYGVDVNPMAVEMAKLSLWLVSMDPQRPFTFLDDRLAPGDSLLGITSLEQIEYMHMDPKKGRELHGEDNALFDFTAGIRGLVSRVAENRRELTGIDGTTLEGLNRKRAVLGNAELETGRLKLLADLTVGAALANASRGERGLNQGSSEAVELAGNLDNDEAEARLRTKEWLDTDRPDGAFERRPLHWPLVFPEVFEKGGFDAVIGNPPFLGGQKITGSMGPAYREYLVHNIGFGVRGSADLVAYFVLLAHHTLNKQGQTGLIATNTLAQGDTREVGLDQIVARNITIRQAVKSEPWPSKSAALEYCAVWTSRSPLKKYARVTVEGTETPGITSALEIQSRATGNPNHLYSNHQVCFQGSNILGLGFTMEPEQAHDLISKDSRNSDVLFPYLNGQDLNSDPATSAPRWVINFHDWPEEKAKKYELCYQQVRHLVKPERDRNNNKQRREIWWRFTRPALDLYRNINGLDRVIVIAQTSNTAMPALVPTGQVFSHMLVVFASREFSTLSILSSSPHYWWAKKYGSKMKADFRYIPSDVFQNFPLPDPTKELRDLGDRLDTYRRDVMLSRDTGLTKTYNLVFDPECTDPDIEELRAIHRAIDEATIRAYGWEERIEAVGGLDHGFHKVGRETRYTIGPAAQREVLDSLLELNHERYAEEVEQGLHDKKKGKRKAAGPQEGTLF